MLTPFIVVDLYIDSYNDSLCLKEPVDGFSFTLRTWLLVDAFCRLAILVIFFLLFIFSCCGEGLFRCWLIISLVFGCLLGFFFLAWLIIGAVMFWGTLNDLGTCDGFVSGYMWATLIINFVLIGVNCLQSNNNRQQI